ncbi:hypothetical protein EVB81_104 [Rhizobium phage RHph_I46]|uniref:Uncharacterized protein n=1 Tax=Rhizobium phage RHph_I1_9 TaxID=2509729 RepID=A0A7S5REV0_9CAUD|nr:hypothetical protein PP936_gp103 [Rhizobium phage RHph_I1_9]QIG69673.1 hypothetical protein EVB81_104 [Rhizobium phage RHph_I46]QIG70954.1 hypothetical protein EVB92_104 [Rhizobium phage RHph_I9]QIG73540.1 hypothetical protein EVC04_103 [Rhizobium phage RHph_I1_9]QIG76293.1 hypothetical protein EVC25_104 [Rhizobium phage RHph_I34]
MTTQINPIAKCLSSKIFSNKVIKSKKIYSRKSVKSKKSYEGVYFILTGGSLFFSSMTAFTFA